MIGKVVRGSNVGGLLRYLYGPGRANEHTDPHLVAGFGDPHELEPDRRADGSPDLRRLTGLLLQPLALDPFGGCEKPVWHCSIRTAPGDRMLSDEEWGQVAAAVMDRTGFARHDDESGVRWVAVRHAPDHIHLVATLARQDGRRARTWNDFFRVREACQDAERRLGLRATAPADRTAAKQPSRAETEQALRRGWDEAPRVSLRREVCAAAAGAGSEREFFARLEQAGVLVRKRHSTINPGEVTGYAVGLADHTTKDGGIVWYGGGKLAPDLTLPKLRARWAGPADEGLGQPVHGVMARAVLRGRVTAAAEQARDEAGFFAQLRESGVLVRLRYSEINPGEVTGYAVAHPGYTERDGSPRWYGGGRLAAGLTLPRLRRNWDRDRADTDPRAGSFRLTGPEREQFYLHAAQQATAAAEQIRRSAGTRPGRGRRYGLGGGRNLPRDGPSDRKPGAAGRGRRLRPRGPDGLREDPAADRRGRQAARSCPAPGHGGRPRRRQHAGSGPADRQPGPVGQGGGRAAPGRAARRAGRSGTAGRGAPLREPQPGEGRRPGARRTTAATAVPHCPEATRHRQPGLPGRRRDPASLHRRPTTASPSRGHSRVRDPCAGRPAAPDRAADSTPAPGSGGPKFKAAQCRPGSIHAA